MAEQKELEQLAEQVVALEAKHNAKLEAFLAEQKEVQAQIKEFWAKVEQGMLDNNIKSIKGDWGTLTIAERHVWQASADLAPRFYRKVLDSKKLTTYMLLNGKVPKGAEHSTKKYLMKRIK